MTTRRRYMLRTSAAIDALRAQLPLGQAEQRSLTARVARYNRDCGCALGGAFMLAALVGFAAYAAIGGRLSLGFVGTGVALVLAASFVGKAAGLAAASLRLALLRRSLARLARREGSAA